MHLHGLLCLIQASTHLLCSTQNSSRDAWFLKRTELTGPLPKSKLLHLSLHISLKQTAPHMMPAFDWICPQSKPSAGKFVNITGAA